MLKIGLIIDSFSVCILQEKKSFLPSLFPIRKPRTQVKKNILAAGYAVLACGEDALATSMKQEPLKMGVISSLNYQESSSFRKERMSKIA